MIRIGIIFFVILNAAGLSGYRFVCNGILANGDERTDDCGVCDNDHAARWENPNIPIVVDEEPRPTTISKDDWEEIIRASFKAWESVVGTSLKFLRLNADNYREFGSNEALHEIFWITDRKEWRKLVGSGEFGTLGATLPRYSCSGSGDGKRVIFDADLVLNGLPHINWQKDCEGDDCISVQTTLVHELGHFFGLDHPCLMCSSSIMSARAGFDLINPVFDDMEGLRALYPDSNNTGGFGYPCTDDVDCNEEHRCITDNNNSYCSAYCLHDGECALGAICRNVGANNACTFVDDENAGGRALGENCMKAPCVSPLVCAGADEPNFFCYESCSKKTDCKPNQDCVDLLEGGSLCVVIKNKNDVCNHRDLCEETLYCIFETRDQGFCRAPCEPTTTSVTGCLAGERCELIDNLVEVCMPMSSNLMLDDLTDGFGQNNGVKKPRPENDTPKIEDPMSCSGLNQQNPAVIWWILLYLALSRGFIKRKTGKFSLPFIW